MKQIIEMTALLQSTKLYFYAFLAEGSKVEMEKVELDGAIIESSQNSKCGRNVLRVSGRNRQVFLGFDHYWEREFWRQWLIKVIH